MPTPAWLLFGIGIPALGSALLFFLIGLTRWRHPESSLLPIGAAITLALAYLAGHWAQGTTGNWPRFPPTEALDWIAIVLLPLGVLTSMFTALPRRLAWWVWGMRGVSSIAVVVLLLLPLARNGDIPWLDRFVALGGAWVLLLTVWFAMAMLASKQPSASLSVAMSMVTAATGALLLIMYDWAVAAHHALTFSAGLAGVALVGLLWSGRHGSAGVMDVTAVVLGGVLVSAPFYTNETHWHAMILGVAPLLAWVGVVPHVRYWPPWRRGLLQVVAVSLPVTIVLIHAVVVFVYEQRGSPYAF